MMGEKVVQKENKYTKEQLTKSNRFQGIQKDFLRAVLEDNQTYTVEEAQKALDNFMKRKVK